jgi:hypothetical protein
LRRQSTSRGALKRKKKQSKYDRSDFGRVKTPQGVQVSKTHRIECYEEKEKNISYQIQV